MELADFHLDTTMLLILVLSILGNLPIGVTKRWLGEKNIAPELVYIFNLVFGFICSLLVFDLSDYLDKAGTVMLGTIWFIILSTVTSHIKLAVARTNTT